MNKRKVAKQHEEMQYPTSVYKEGCIGDGECEGASTDWRDMRRWREDETAFSMLDNISMATTVHAQRTAKISQDPGSK